MAEYKRPPLQPLPPPYKLRPIPSEKSLEKLDDKRLKKHYRWTQEQIGRIRGHYMCSCCSEYLHTKDEENEKLYSKPFRKHAFVVKSMLDARARTKCQD